MGAFGNRSQSTQAKPVIDLLLALQLMACCAALPAQDDTRAAAVEVIELRHRLASELLPVITPLLGEGSTVTGSGNLLFVRAAADDRDAISELVARLDQVQRQFRIAIRQTTEDLIDTGRDAAAGYLRIDSNRTGDGGDDVAGSPIVQLRTIRTHDRNNDEHLHFVVVREGESAFVQTGSEVPLASRLLAVGVYGAALHDSINYRAISAGFEVTPRLRGEVLQLEITPWAERLAEDGGGRIITRQAQTSVAVAPGIWLELAAAVTGQRAFSDTTLARTRHHDDQTMRIGIRVDEIR